MLSFLTPAHGRVHSANNRRIFITGFSQSNQRSVYENEYIRNATIYLLVKIAQLVEDPAEADQITFIKRHRAFESRKLLLLFSFLFIYIQFIFIFFSFIFIIACFYMFISFSVILFINIFNTFMQIKFFMIMIVKHDTHI